MNIGALQKFSLIEYPGKICAIVFTQGCNFRCPYCHNRELVDPEAYGPTITESDVFSFLEKRKKKLDAVTVTGGEPTLQPDIFSFLEKLKTMGYLTKVDSNGSHPEVLKKLIDSRLVDYIALDVKAPLARYREITRSG
ncbi:MAG TPA: anaerobic ribonucleoside-triphosphate reductase activating protein, partial [Syntrophales bacterium]|nr:anaerobic ribonucleoside-triphosphate reductase activating protein [Syntrophales bacterium]